MLNDSRVQTEDKGVDDGEKAGGNAAHISRASQKIYVPISDRVLNWLIRPRGPKAIMSWTQSEVDRIEQVAQEGAAFLNSSKDLSSSAYRMLSVLDSKASSLLRVASLLGVLISVAIGSPNVPLWIMFAAFFPISSFAVTIILLSPVLSVSWDESKYVELVVRRTINYLWALRFCYLGFALLGVVTVSLSLVRLISTISAP